MIKKDTKPQQLVLTSNDFKSIELCAGAGGLALGIERALFNNLALIEIDKDAVETLKINRPH